MRKARTNEPTTVLDQLKATHAQAVSEEADLRMEIAILETQLEQASESRAQTARIINALGQVLVAEETA